MTQVKRVKSGATAVKVRTNFKEGDVVINRDRALAALSCFEKGVLLVHDEVMVICYYNPERGSLDVNGTRPVILNEHYRYATAEESGLILTAMKDKTFTTHRGPNYFDRWQRKLKKVIEPLIEKVGQSDV